MNTYIIQLIILLGLMVCSCSEKLDDTQQVEVPFCATLKNDGATKSFGNGLHVNTLVVGVYDKNFNYKTRQSFPIESTTVNAQLSLAKAQTYNLVFWAYNEEANHYNIDNLTDIKMIGTAEPVSFEQMEKADCFYATLKGFEVKTDGIEKIWMERPVAQINIGTAGKAVSAELKATGAHDTFNPFTGKTSGNCEFKWAFQTTTIETFTVNNTCYTYLAMGYVFAPQYYNMEIGCKLKLTSPGDGYEAEKHFPTVVVHANYRSNIAGNFTQP